MAVSEVSTTMLSGALGRGWLSSVAEARAFLLASKAIANHHWLLEGRVILSCIIWLYSALAL